jgi:hypothetical protein
MRRLMTGSNVSNSLEVVMIRSAFIFARHSNREHGDGLWVPGGARS